MMRMLNIVRQSVGLYVFCIPSTIKHACGQKMTV